MTVRASQNRIVLRCSNASTGLSVQVIPKAADSDWRSCSRWSATTRGGSRWKARQERAQRSGSSWDRSTLANLLIVDDDANTLASLARAFRLAGHEATVCDNAAGESCPAWPGQPMTAHWGVPDPAEAKGAPAEIALAFKDAYRMLFQRIGIFTASASVNHRPRAQ